MYMHDDDSTRTNFVLTGLQGEGLDPSMATQCGTLKTRLTMTDQSTSSTSVPDSDNSESSFSNDFNVDASETSSFVAGDDDDLDELEKALEVYAIKEARRASQASEEQVPDDTKRAPFRRSKSDLTNMKTPGAAEAAARRGNRRRSTNTLLANDDDDKSVGSNKSLPLSALYDCKPSSKNGKSSNNSSKTLTSLCNVKDKLANVFGDTSFIKKIHWDSYFQQTSSEEGKDAGNMIMTDELDRAIRSKKVHRLQRLAKKGVNMNARNQLGESVVSLVCRAGSAEQLVYLMKNKVSVRVRDRVGKTPLHEVAWAPTFQPSIAMMLMSDSPELLWAPDARGYLALDYAPKRCLVDWYEFLEFKQPILRLSLQFSRFKASSHELNCNQERLRIMLEQKLTPGV
jgi:hypothetical protein